MEYCIEHNHQVVKCTKSEMEQYLAMESEFEQDIYFKSLVQTRPTRPVYDY